jgi:hypothetical protein
MKPIKPLFCKKADWHGRTGYVIGNQFIRLTVLTGGGHIADLRFEDSVGTTGVSPLWIPPWRTIDPQCYREKVHVRQYGTLAEGKLLSGIVGHSICLDYFGSSSAEEVKQGLSLHGEAPSSRWQANGISVGPRRVALTMSVRLSAAGLRFSREIELKKGESVVYIQEVVCNERSADHFFHWTQHVTLGLPFLSSGEAVVTIPGTKGLTYPHGYDEGKALLASNRVFRWPMAPLANGGTVDLRHPFSHKGLGFVVGILLDRRKEIGFIAAMNRNLGLLIAYCFKRSDFPWVAIWEENLAVAAPPWKLRTCARGLEFGTTPLPVSRREAFVSGRRFGEPTLTCVPALGRKRVNYLALLARIPDGFGDVKDIDLVRDQVLIYGRARKKPVVMRAVGIEKLLD